MSDAEKTLARLFDLIEYKTGHKIADYLDAVDALDSLLLHEAAAGKIPRYGSNWFSQEDRVALHKKISPAPDFRTMQPNLIPQFLAASAHCRDGKEFSSLVANLLMTTHDCIADLQRRVLDYDTITIRPQFIPK